jgi:hypothetical protein
MNHIPRPIIITALAIIALAAAVLITATVVTSVSRGVELTARGVGFPALLWFLTLVLTGLAAIGWWQRRRYIRGTTPEERRAARLTKPPPAHRPGDDLDYGTRVEDAP